MREGYKVVALLWNLNLGLFGLMGWCRVLPSNPGSATGHLIAPGDYHTLQHIQVHFGVNFQADFEDMKLHDVLSLGLPLHHFQRVVRCVELCPQALKRPDLHFEGAGNGPVVIIWIGREHELSGASPISLVEHCVTFRHDRRLLSLLGFLHNWPTSR